MPWKNLSEDVAALFEETADIEGLTIIAHATLREQGRYRSAKYRAKHRLEINARQRERSKTYGSKPRDPRQRHEYYLRNKARDKERFLEYRRERRRNLDPVTRAKYKATRDAWKARNREKLQKQERKRRAKLTRAAYMREWRKTHKSDRTAWYQRNRERILSRLRAKRAAAKAQSGGTKD